MTSPGRTTSEQDESALVEGLRRNDRETLATLYDAYGAVAYGLALKLVGSQTEAEDVVQESFLALWRQAERLDAARGIRSYLLSIVHNRAVDRVRRRQRAGESQLDEDAPMPAPTEDPAETVMRQSERDEVRAVLGTLSTDQRQTVEMRLLPGPDD